MILQGRSLSLTQWWSGTCGAGVRRDSNAHLEQRVMGRPMGFSGGISPCGSDLPQIKTPKDILWSIPSLSLPGTDTCAGLVQHLWMHPSSTLYSMILMKEANHIHFCILQAGLCVTGYALGNEGH